MRCTQRRILRRHDRDDICFLISNLPRQSNHHIITARKRDGALQPGRTEGHALYVSGESFFDDLVNDLRRKLLESDSSALIFFARRVTGMRLAILPPALESNSNRLLETVRHLFVTERLMPCLS